MEELKITGRDHNQKLIVLKKGLLTTNDISSAAIVCHHHGMIQRAVEVLDEESIHERQVSSLTFKMPKSHLPKAKEKLFKFLSEFNKEFATENSEEIFQLNIQLFSHTKPYHDSEVTQ